MALRVLQVILILFMLQASIATKYGQCDWGSASADDRAHDEVGLNSDEAVNCSGRPWRDDISERILRRLVEYCKMDTQASAESKKTPSTDKQWKLARELKNEAEGLGFATELTEFGYTIVHAEGSHKDAPRIGLFAHLDTALEFPSDGVQPLIHECYAGGDIHLPNCNVTIGSELLSGFQKDTLVTTDGSTLLGADDKTGIAIAMTFLEEIARGQITHYPPLRVVFNPDEEIGHGMRTLDLEKLSCRAGYTLDSPSLGSVQRESFNAETLHIRIDGVSVHPGKAKGHMVNALQLAAELIDRLPKERSPQTTEGREGYIFPRHLQGGVAEANLTILLRSFSQEELSEERDYVLSECKSLQKKEPRARISCIPEPSYINPAELLAKDPEPFNKAWRATEKAVGFAEEVVMRGGTDGSTLAKRGFVAPNIFAGYHNAHGPREFASLRDMRASFGVICRLMQEWGEESRSS